MPKPPPPTLPIGRPGLASMILFLLASIASVSPVSGHGHMTSPRSRNFLSTPRQDGVNSPEAGSPPAETCEHCLNHNDGICGFEAGGDSYDTFLDSMGQPMKWHSELIATEGDEVTIRSYMDTHHNGHVEIRLCEADAEGEAPAQDQCYRTEPQGEGCSNCLTFVRDESYDLNDVLEVTDAMPLDPDYPERGYLSLGQSGGSHHEFKMVFKLPFGVTGDNVFFVWRYITANSCQPKGYTKYFSDNALPDVYWTAGLSPCPDPLPLDGMGAPEQFYNCAEATILSALPTPPTPAPPTPPPAPPTPTPPTSEEKCCTTNFQECTGTWGPKDEAECDSWSGHYWVATNVLNVPAGCNGRDWGCADNTECCDALACLAGQCKYVEGTPSPPTPNPVAAPTPNPPAPTPNPPTPNPPATPTPNPPAPTPNPPTATTPTIGGSGCCSIDFKTCYPTHLTNDCRFEANCVGSCGKYWLPNGEITGCIANWDPCSSGGQECCGPATCVSGSCYNDGWGTDPTAPTPPTPAPPTPPPAPPAPAPPTSEEKCCTTNFQECTGTWGPKDEAECDSWSGHYWVATNVLNVPAGCNGRDWGCADNTECCDALACLAGQCKYVEGTPSPPTPNPVAAPTPNPPAPTPNPPTPNPPATPTPNPPTPNPPEPTPSPPTTPTSLYSCTKSGVGGSTSYDALLAMEAITSTISTDPYTLAVQSSGGAAGGVVSEGQAYGVLTAALALTSMTESDSNYGATKDKFEGYFNAWRIMCRESTSVAYCQSPKYCDGGTSPCLPGWKHKGDLSGVDVDNYGTGSAPDGDEDAIVGMIIAVKAVEDDADKPMWYDEVHDWADRSCTQFMQDNTKLSKLGGHRLVKLGSCWGGWDGNGNNPSYHAPGHYRMMRDFQASVTGPRDYTLPDSVTVESWNSLIDTSYKFLATTQCPDTGLVPNWALVKELDSQTLAKDVTDPKHIGFSGSGTPQYQFGSEASRTMWRIAFDAAAYPEESAAQAGAFLAPLQSKLVENFDPSPSDTVTYFGDNTLQTCGSVEDTEDPIKALGPIVDSIHSTWRWNYFISAPVYSTLVAGISTDELTGLGFNQQDMVDTACDLVEATDSQSYYSLSWLVIAKMTLNGDVARAGQLVGQPPAPTPAPVPTTPAPTQEPTSMPSTSPTASPTSAPTAGCFSNNYRDCNMEERQAENDTCTTIWLPAGGRNDCIALWGQCTGQVSGCCTPAVCQGDGSYAQCVPNPEQSSRKLLRKQSSL